MQTIFDRPDAYGKGLNWAPYTVYDAATLILRYLKSLPEPIITFDLYDRFVAAMSWATGPGQSQAEYESQNTIFTLQGLITELQPLSRQLLLYLLDLLAVFASKSDDNLMTTSRLVSMFQPALLSKPSAVMSLKDYEDAAIVMIFIVENQDHFLIGMRRTVENDTGVVPQNADLE